MALSLAVQESHRGPHGRRFPMRKAPRECLWPMWMWMVRSVSFVAFPARSHTDQTRPAGQHPVYVLFLFSLSDIGLPPCISVSGLLCQLFVFCRSQCEQGPIPIFLVMLPNRSCLFTQFCTKYCISIILAQWRLVPPENTVLTICSNVCSFCNLCANHVLLCNKGCVNRESGNCGFSFGYSWSRVFQACAACDIISGQRK